MAGITTALVVFILVGVALPALIKSKAQFYCAVAFTAAAILISPFAFVVFMAFLVAILQVLAFVALVLCAGGLELHEFAEHMVNAYDALRHGEVNKPIIVPRTGEMPKKKPAIITPIEPIHDETPIPIEPPPPAPPPPPEPNPL
jgi:hypothetical protein